MPDRIGTGSGVIISPNVYIITNHHVIENNSEIEITTNDNKTYQATVVGSDPSSDIAVLKINTDQKLPYVFFGNSDSTKIGEWVLAVGNPFNLNSTVTAGIISAKARDLNQKDRKNEWYLQKTLLYITKFNYVFKNFSSYIAWNCKGIANKSS